MQPDRRGDWTLTHSRKQMFLTCRLKHHIAYVMGVRREPSAALRMGSAIHAALDVLKHDGELADAYEVIMANYLSLINAKPDYQDEYLVEREKCLRLVQGWAWRWGESKIEIILSEFSFSHRLRNLISHYPSHRWMCAGKIDSICKLEDGRLALIEHKTTGDSIGSDAPFWQALELNSQISDYMIAARWKGIEVQTVLYDVIHKPGIKPKKIKGLPETISDYGERLLQDIYTRPDFYFARREIPRLDRDLDVGRRDAWLIAQDIYTDLKREHHYVNSNACKSPYPCPYLGICKDWQALEHDPLPEGFVRIEYLHPELEKDDANLEKDDANE